MARVRVKPGDKPKIFGPLILLGISVVEANLLRSITVETLDMLIGGHGAHNEKDFDRASTLYDQLVIAKYNIDSAISAQEAAIICPPSRSTRTAAQHAQAMDQFDDAQEALMADEFARFMSGLDKDTRLALRAKLNDLKDSTTYVKLDHGKAYAAQGMDITATVDGWCRGRGK